MIEVNRYPCTRRIDWNLKSSKKKKNEVKVSWKTTLIKKIKKIWSKKRKKKKNRNLNSKNRFSLVTRHGMQVFCFIFCNLIIAFIVFSSLKMKFPRKLLVLWGAGGAGFKRNSVLEKLNQKQIHGSLKFIYRPTSLHTSHPPPSPPIRRWYRIFVK